MFFFTIFGPSAVFVYKCTCFGGVSVPFRGYFGGVTGRVKGSALLLNYGP